MGNSVSRTATIGALIEEGVILVHKDGNHGSNYPRVEEFGSEGVPFLTAKLLDDSGNIDFENAPRLGSSKADKFKFGFIEKGDVLLSHNATVGRVAIVPDFGERVLIGTSLTHFRLDTARLLPKYLAAYFSGREFQNQLTAVMSQTTRNQVPITSQRTLSVVIPPITEQERIADILGSFDDKIELNRQINQTLEQIAQAIFKSWFVDFEPVQAKIEAKTAGRDPERAAMCTISGKLEPELDQLPPGQRQQLAATAALFPAELVESELGLIPVGWEVKPFAEMVQLIGGGTPKRSNSKYWGGNIPWFSVQDAPAEGNVFVVDTKEKITKIGLKKSSTKLLPIGTTIISARGTVGRLALIDVEMAMNQSCYGVIGTNSIGPYFNYFNLKNAVAMLQQNTHGAVFDTITRQTFETVSCVDPTKPILESFEVVLAPLMHMICGNIRQCRTLSDLCNTLLPKLLSCELISKPDDLLSVELENA